MSSKHNNLQNPIWSITDKGSVRWAEVNIETYRHQKSVYVLPKVSYSVLQELCTSQPFLTPSQQLQPPPQAAWYQFRISVWIFFHPSHFHRSIFCLKPEAPCLMELKHHHVCIYHSKNSVYWLCCQVNAHFLTLHYPTIQLWDYLHGGTLCVLFVISSHKSV